MLNRESAWCMVVVGALVAACSASDREVNRGTGGAGGNGGAAGAAGNGGSATGGAPAGGGGASGAGGGSTGGAPGGGGTGGSGATGGGSGGVGCTPPAPGGECDTFPQCGCPGKNCSVDTSTGLTKCITAGTIGPYQPCSKPEDCGAGYACASGLCKAFCDTKADCTATSGECVQVKLISGSVVPGVFRCTKKCRLEDAPGTCGSGLTCFADDTATYTDCGGIVGTGVGLVGCTASVECAPGYACGASTGACRKWCRQGHAVEDCPAGKTCDAVGNAPTFDGFVYGLCSL